MMWISLIWLNSKTSLYYKEKKTISTAQLGWAMKWFIILHHDHCTSLTWLGAKMITKSIAQAHPGWAEKHSCNLFTAINSIAYNNMCRVKNPCLIPFPCTNKIPHNLQPTEKLKQTLGRRILILKMLSTYALGKLNVFGHNCHPFSVYGKEIGIFQKPNQICPCSFMVCPLWFLLWG